MEYLFDILPHLSNPNRKAAFFGAIFNNVLRYSGLVDGTQKTAQIPGVNELFRIGSFENPLMVSPRIFGWNSFDEDLILLRNKLADLGMEYRDSKVYLADLDELEGDNVQA